MHPDVLERAPGDPRVVEQITGTLLCEEHETSRTGLPLSAIKKQKKESST